MKEILTDEMQIQSYIATTILLTIPIINININDESFDSR